MRIKIKRRDKTLPLPQYKTPGAAAFDLASREALTIKAGEIGYAPANVVFAIPKGYVLLLLARSSLHKRGLMLANNVGVLDSDYRGENDECIIALYNFSKKPVLVEKGERIAQGIIFKTEKAIWRETEKMGAKSRGGFGSTGRK